jgi:zinc transporter, ZIP family
MANLPLLLALTTVMGLAIFLSLPLVFSRRVAGRAGIVINAAAIGILVFLLADIYGDVASLISAGTAAYLTLGDLDGVFVLAVGAAFLLLYFLETKPIEGVEQSPRQISTIIALAMGFQNLTEGLVFGAAYSAEIVGLSTVVFVGFFLQNVSEGFPIAAPFLSTAQRDARTLVPLYLVGGLPTVLGGAIGFFYSSSALAVLFDGAAIGSILYVLVPMIRGVLRPLPTPAASYARSRLVFLGILAGFLLGFLVNAI